MQMLDEAFKEHLPNYVSAAPDIEPPVLTICKDKRYEMNLEPNFGLSMIDEKYDIIAFEQGKKLTGQSYEVELLIQQSRSSYYFFTRDHLLTQSRLLTIGSDMSERKIKKAIYRMLRPVIRSPDIQHKLRGNEDED
jgi:hypothetical protein